MPRTTINIDAPVLKDLKQLQKAERKSLGRLVSDLLAWAIRTRKDRPPAPPRFSWNSKSMQPRLDIADKEALWSALDRRQERPPRD